MTNFIKLYYDPAAVVDPPAAVIPAVEPPVAVDPAAPVDLKPASVSTTIDLNKVDPPPVKVETFIIPDAFKDKPYLKGVDSQEKLFKMLDGAQELIGKKGPGIPKADAPQAEKDAYYDSIGRPKTAAEYTPVLTGADKTDPKVLPKLQAAFHKAGLTTEQAKIVWDESSTAFSDFAKETNLAAEQNNVDFDKLATDTFGVERDKVLARGKELISANISPSMKAAVEKLPNESLIVLADVLRNLDKKYIKQDGPGQQPTVTGATPDDLRAKARGLMAQQKGMDVMGVEFQNLQKQIDGIYDQIRRGTK